MTDLAQLRADIGASNALWAGADGVHPHGEGWAAFSGKRSVVHNVVLCVGKGQEIDAAVELVLARRVPAVIMVAGAALGEVQRLAARAWVCVGSTPLMVRDLTAEEPAAGPAPRNARLITSPEQIARARQLVVDAFNLDAELGAIALPEPQDGQELWGSFDEAGSLRACLALVRAGESAVVLSMVSDPTTRGQGFGVAALFAALDNALAEGAARALLYSSVEGEDFYRSTGFHEVERWQIWSRPRWVLGRA